ncbi:hypothetical protein SASPL_127545 [Salvia splendens]|uniref:Vesicle-associated membrane protein 7 n=1 Tax=Salvia splendens TaxID=180675 RepID=A0A8X8XC50_SALSN|nr:hypothetical protein SASPL_127545 [Salvia splendens]
MMKVGAEAINDDGGIDEGVYLRNCTDESVVNSISLESDQSELRKRGGERKGMAILYALVARGSVVLAEYSATSTTANAIARQILEKIPGNNDTNASYSQDRYIFHVKRTDGLTVLCMADDTAGRRIPFAFLEEIHQRFVRTYGRAVLSAQPYAMNDEFSRVLSQQIEYFSSDPNADRINRLKGEMSQVRNVMIENIDKVLDRGDRLELLVDKTATMQGNTFRFRKQARRFRNTVWWRNVKLTIALIFLLLSKFVCKAVSVGHQLYLDIAQEHARTSLSICSGRQSWYYGEFTFMAAARAVVILSFLLLSAAFTSGCGTCKPHPAPKVPPPNPFCPRDTLKLGVCADLLGLVNVVVGAPPSGDKCCPLLEGLADLEVAACLCTAIKANVLGINLDIPVALSVLLSACQKTVPPGFKCV